MKKQVTFSFFIICFFWIIGCSTNSGPSTYTVTTSVSPAEAGTINPSTEEFEEGTSVTLEAIPNEGWEFQEWTGSITSTENPLNHTVEEDVNLTANFRDITSEYSVEMTLSDGIEEIQLEFGQDLNPASMSSQVPPSPPEGSLHAYFEKNGKTWWRDYREDHQTSVTWNLSYQIGEYNIIVLDWKIDASKLEGTLILESQDGSVEVDMNQESSIDLSGGTSNSLQIRYLLLN